MKKRKWEINEITKILECTIGGTEPYGDSSIDEQIEDNLKVLIDVTNWCLDGIYDAARHRGSDYASMRNIGERAYAAMLEWKEWLANREEELA